MISSILLLMALAQEPVALYPATGVFTNDLDHPSFTPYLAEKGKASGAAVIVCPGGGYQNLAMDHEGVQIARWLNSLGVHAFVLKYRLGPRHHHPAMLNDVSEAFKIVRSRSTEWGVDPKRVGVWGFSAGGHLASTISTHFTPETRPDFAILSYPVITCTESWKHKGSCKNLLGSDTPDPKLAELMSNEKQVTKDTPPTFLFHTTDDQAVPVENALAYYSSLRKNGVEVEMHIFEHGRHGVGLAPGDWVLSSWADLLAKWLVRHGVTK
ncbi:alpha/beta hydrolase [Bryobacter aggregatus]|uniref:alpha/beta hydrolase n=1 Tax=Bryobacter aggregatus TaxID=360054 RepID=UPI0004E24F70|nr:alpha/beta hydrolase [Bryobacter aggregatus]